jgi:UDP-galactopyranose mutase
MDKGYSVTIYETADEVGGACMDCNGNQLFGYHIMHTNDRAAWEYLCRFTSFKNYVHSVMANTDRGLVPIPYNYHTEAITGALSDLQIQALIFDEYSRKQWGHTFSELPDEVRARVSLRREGTDSRYFTDTYQGIPSDGFCAMLKKMIDGCELKLGAEKDEWKNHKADIIIYTGSPDMIYNCDNGQLPYRSVKFEDTNEKLPAAVVNDCTANVPYTRKHDYRYIGGNITQIETPEDYEEGKNQPYYPVDGGRDMADDYISRALDDGIYCLGRAGKYKYINMDVAVIDAIKTVDEITQKNKINIAKKFSKRKENIRLFYHVAMMGSWKQVLAEQLETLNNSGILDVCKSVTAVCVGAEKDLPDMPYPIKVVYGGELNKYEFPTLEKMHESAKRNPNDYYCYIHSKGVSKPQARSWLDSGWRQYMMWGVIEQWRECIDSLNAGHDIAGVEWYNNVIPCKTGGKPVDNCHGFFAGNFFWASGKHLKTLPEVETLDSANRWNAEAWIGLGDKPNVYEVLNVHTIERTGMFPRSFCRDTYLHKDNIIYVDVKTTCNSKNSMNKKIHDQTGDDCIVFVHGLRQKFMMFKNFLEVTSEPKKYHRKITI